MKIISRLLISLIAVSAISANAALYNRGNGMIYDSTQNITWLQDANYSKTSGYDADGKMTWNQAKSWADNLIYGGFSDWRLPSARLIDTTLYPINYDGSHDYGYNNTRSELGHLYTELGNISRFDTEGNQLSTYNSWSNSNFIDAKTGLTVWFINLGCHPIYACAFWYNEQRNATNAWVFNGDNGFQFPYGKHVLYSAWAVRDGDVAPTVPVPAAAWLMGSGLIGLAGIARRKK